MRFRKPPTQFRLPAKAASLDDLMDAIDFFFELIDLFNAIIEAITNFGAFLNGESPNSDPIDIITR